MPTTLDQKMSHGESCSQEMTQPNYEEGETSQLMSLSKSHDGREAGQLTSRLFFKLLSSVNTSYSSVHTTYEVVLITI